METKNEVVNRIIQIEIVVILVGLLYIILDGPVRFDPPYITSMSQVR